MREGINIHEFGKLRKGLLQPYFGDMCDLCRFRMRVQTVPVEDARQNGVQSIHDCALYGTQDVLKDIRSLRRHILPRSPCGCRLPGWWMEKRMRKRTDCRFEKRGPRRSDLGK